MVMEQEYGPEVDAWSLGDTAAPNLVAVLNVLLFCAPILVAMLSHLTVLSLPEVLMESEPASQYHSKHQVGVSQSTSQQQHTVLSQPAAAHSPQPEASR